jgi:glycosyltransferase involved in cell wall biosynthesis
MRVALVTNVCTHYRRPLFKSVAERFDVDFYFTSPGREWYQPSHEAAGAGGLRAVSERRPLPLGHALVRGAYDCVVVSLVGRSTLLAAVAAAKLARRPLVLWVGIWSHPTTAFHRLSRPVVRALYRRADALIVYGPHVARYLADESGRTDGVFEVRQAVDNELFRRPVERARVAKVRESVGAGRSSVGCFVGRLEAEKGLETLLHGLARTTAEQKLLVVGSGSLEPQLRVLAASLGLERRVVFTGQVAQKALPAYLQAVDFLVLPSMTTRRFKEPWGLVVNEAMNSGLPVIATDAVGAGAGGLVVDNETGFLIPEGDPLALAAAMDELARNDANRRRLGANGAQRVLQWSFAAATDAFERAVLEAVERKGRNGAGAARA